MNDELLDCVKYIIDACRAATRIGAKDEDKAAVNWLMSGIS